MPSINTVILAGNLTRDPEMRYTPSGMSICTLGMAINRRYENRDGESQEDTCFVDIDAFGRQAEACAEHLHKGSAALVEGRLHFDSWEDRESGQRRSKLTVTAVRVEFLGGRGDDDSQDQRPAEERGGRRGRGGDRNSGRNYSDSNNRGDSRDDRRGGGGRGDSRGADDRRGDSRGSRGGYRDDRRDDRQDDRRGGRGDSRGSQRGAGRGRGRETSPPFPDSAAPGGPFDRSAPDDDSVDDIPF